MYNRCKECDSLLWTINSQQTGLCPECKMYNDMPDIADSLTSCNELESQLEMLLEQADNSPTSDC